MADTTAEVHLKRSYGLVAGVEKVTEEFRSRAIQHDARTKESNEPFLTGLVGAYTGSRQLTQQKSALVSDLQLATQEVDKAAGLAPNAIVETSDGHFDVKRLRAMIMFLSGQLETIWGTAQRAKELFADAAETFDFPDPHYMLGLLYEDEYKPAEALSEFEKCLELDPAGELSVPALREANAMRNYKKKFRGNWLILIILLCCWIVPGVIYFKVKYK